MTFGRKGHDFSKAVIPNFHATLVFMIGLVQLSKALVSGSDWPDKDELLDVLYWGRQLLALILGIFWGFIPLHGFLAILLYIGISTTAGQLYATNFQKV